MQPFQFQKNLYFAMALTVLINPSQNYICNYFLVEHYIIQLCSSNGNGDLSGRGIFCILLDGSRIIFKYHIILGLFHHVMPFIKGRRYLQNKFTKVKSPGAKESKFILSRESYPRKDLRNNTKQTSVPR